MRRRRLRRALRRRSPVLIWGGVVAAALGCFGAAAWWGQRGDGAAEAVADAAPSNATPALPSAGAAGAPPPVGATAGALPAVGAVSPGALSYSAEAPADTTAPSGEALCPGCDVVIVTLCSLRRDHVSAYGERTAGGREGLTPALDRIAAEGGFRFDQAWSASNFTLASLTAILTGRFASTTGVTGWDKGLGEGVPTLPEVLGYYGYRTGAFTIDAASGFRPDYGLHRGFQTMQIIPAPRGTPDGRRRGGGASEPGASAAPAADWIRSQPADAPLMTMLHSRTAHFPFVIEAPESDPSGVLTALWDAGESQSQEFGHRAMPGMAGGTDQQGVVAFTGEDPVQASVRAAGDPGVAAWREAYADAVAWMDRDLAAVMDALEESGRLDRTIVVAVADHGESLDDHGELLHGDSYFDGVVHVPLLVRVPGLGGRGATAIEGLVGHVDLMPTILELVGALPPADIDGRSFIPLLTGAAEQTRAATLIEGGVARQDSSTPRGAVIAPPWALLRQDIFCGEQRQRPPGEPLTCLFHLEDDPEQVGDLSLERPDVVEGLLGAWNSHLAQRAGSATELELSPAFVDLLQRTGYDFQPLE